MENPPDLLVAFTSSDDQYHEKKKFFVENSSDEENQQHEELLSNLQSNKYALECELQQVRTERSSSYHNNEFHEQLHLLKQRFSDEIQSINYHQTELIHHIATDLPIHVTDILQKSIDDIESLRLLHQKELCNYSKTLADCIQHQSCEMSQLCHHLLDQQHTNSTNFFEKFIDEFHMALNDLKTSFDSKVNYLNDIHSSTIDKLNSKHQIELNELKCELHLLSNR